MKNTTIKAVGYYSLKYDPTSTEFILALSDYREMIDKSATELDMLINVVHQLRIGGAYRMLEGVGYVKYQGKIMGQPYSGIEAIDVDPDYEYE